MLSFDDVGLVSNVAPLGKLGHDACVPSRAHEQYIQHWDTTVTQFGSVDQALALELADNNRVSCIR